MTNKKFKIGTVETVAIAIGILLLVLFAYNSIQLLGASTGDVTLVSASKIIPRGVPAIYGSELGISYDDVSASNPKKADATIRLMGNLDRTITLNGADLQRYIKISSKISCEFCCGAASIIFSDGRAACGCAHSYAMRGLAKYLITKHPDMSDDEILTEMAKWKVLFFPGIHETKAKVLSSQGININYINLASNKYHGAEKGAQQSDRGMVGGC